MGKRAGESAGGDGEVKLSLDGEKAKPGGLEIRPDPRNARRHTDRNKAVIRQSLQEVGAFRSIAVDGDGVIRAGNGVFEQAKVLGLKVRTVEAAPDELVAVVRPDLRGKEAERAALWDNQSGDTSEWNPDTIRWLIDNEPEVVQGVFDPGEIDDLLLASMIEFGETNTSSGKNKRNLGNPDAIIRAALYIEQIAILEQAIRSTGIANRGKAIECICKSYLENNDEADAEGQYDFTA